MANPNTALRYIVKNPAKEVHTFRTAFVAEECAAGFRLKGNRVRVTRCYDGKISGKKNYVHRVFVY